ncbi:hypothetical protein FB566_0350 [Stackebrandtia endophytica]|uniref:Uncharacterized protein n=2 Tax=Stackebrandtia endophytica TaxID=1496996 RepID=A0A543AQI9_9ACTN|nr:hypothetical protein FB566_0350 [Stackebrandtia endophytica]
MVAGVGLLFFAGCSSAAPLPEALPTPAEARLGAADDDSFTAVQLALASLHEDLSRHYDGPWDVEYYTFPDSDATRWSALQSLYQNALGPGWELDERYPGEAFDYLQKVWSNGNTAIAIALVGGESTDTLIVLSPG